MSGILQGRVLHEGTGHGEALVLDEPLSFWGGFDPVTGCIIDAYHPQAGLCISGRVLALIETRGSAATPGSIAESVRRGTAPAAIVLVKSDVNVAVGAMIASVLYDIDLPVIALDEAGAFQRLTTGTHVRVTLEGAIIEDSVAGIAHQQG